MNRLGHGSGRRANQSSAHASISFTSGRTFVRTAVGYRRQAITALGWCLERPSMMLLNPDMFDEIRSELLADLNDPDWSVREHAVDALPAVRTDPEVRARLQIVATTDPYVASEHYSVREAASFMLSSDSFSFYVTRESDTRLCSVQQTSEALIVQQFIGPERKAVLKPLMCSHYDPTGQDASLCWKVEPADACSPGVIAPILPCLRLQPNLWPREPRSVYSLSVPATGRFTHAVVFLAPSPVVANLDDLLSGHPKSGLRVVNTGRVYESARSWQPPLPGFGVLRPDGSDL
jgi:hypothetical protein